MTLMSFAERLRQPTPLFATFSLINSPVMVELIAHAGFDAVVLDMEHGPLGPESLNVLIPAARAAGVAPLVRVRANEPSLIGAALDVGAAGVVVPQVGSAAAAAAAVDAARFTAGHRGSNPYVRAAGYSTDAGFFARADAETAVLVMVEGMEGIAALPQILKMPGLDGIFVGPFDLSHSLGLAGQVEHPTVVARIESIVREAAAQQVATAVFAPTPAMARRWRDLGVRLVALGFDTALALQGLRAAREAV
jgi:4-hydroxy-2-oxoheptanedioate aldolase